jgi:hypothetical protein
MVVVAVATVAENKNDDPSKTRLVEDSYVIGCPYSRNKFGTSLLFKLTSDRNRITPAPRRGISSDAPSGS